MSNFAKNTIVSDMQFLRPNFLLLSNDFKIDTSLSFIMDFLNKPCQSWSHIDIWSHFSRKKNSGKEFQTFHFSKGKEPYFHMDYDIISHYSHTISKNWILKYVEVLEAGVAQFRMMLYMGSDRFDLCSIVHMKVKFIALQKIWIANRSYKC